MKLIEAHELWEQGALEEALKLLKEIETPTIDVQQDIALIYLEMGEVETASTLFYKIIEEDQHFAGGYYGLGMCMDELGDTEEALSYYMKTVFADPEHTSAFIAIGDIFATDQLDECIEYYEAARELSPDYWLPVSSIGDYLQSQKRFEEAIHFYIDAIEIEPNFWSYHGLGYCYDKIGTTESAIEAYQDGLKLHEYSYTHFNLGVIFKDLGRYDEALIQYNAAMKSHEDVVFYYNRGCLFNLMGRTELAKQDLLLSFKNSTGLQDYSLDDKELDNLKEWLRSL